MKDGLTLELSDLASCEPDVLIVGSGPAGVAVAEYLYSLPSAPVIAMIERGGILTTTHISNMLPARVAGQTTSPIDRRAGFLQAHGKLLWDGAFAQHGIMITALGGRGIVAGAHLRRFDPVDFTAWDAGRWPITADVLSPYYTEAEVRRHVRAGDCDGAAQNWVLGELHSLGAAPPPWGVDSRSIRNLEAGRGYDSSVGRLWTLILDDFQNSTTGTFPAQRRMLVATHTLATKLRVSNGQVTGVVCRDTRRDGSDRGSFELRARLIVLAASPIESARLALVSGVGGEAAGKYLAEHIYCRREVSIHAPKVIGDIHGLAVRAVIPPANDDANNRFQIEIMGEEDPQQRGLLRLRFTGECAMDPRPENRVTLSDAEDDYGVPKATVTFSLSRDDETRVQVMKSTMTHVAEQLGVPELDGFQKGITVLPPGRSHHEAGTLRMGSYERDPESVTDRHGRVQGIANLYVADASVFPCVGVANPMLTVTALAYRQAEYLDKQLIAMRSALVVKRRSTGRSRPHATP
jgi:choline dehydrogenase-like flavoprotein